ncbi:cardiolipin synthase [Planococcus lenghuensis]|uniref:Cardiolipin synthase n=1 Tax=Planococcus lenghuensis TaxID=2213202 RepID=A0A1Q2KZX0_9BACL|nr:cardiolipin synthase [Planococcus lenghuensis]AQQ53367.1 cardiolipin synthase [Planococcus lenghuensis]
MSIELWQTWSNIGNLFFLLNIILAVIIIFYERKNSSSLWAWLMVLFFLPVVGFFLYFFFGRTFKKDKLKHQSAYYHPELENISEHQLHEVTTGSFHHYSSVTRELEGLILMNLKSETAPLTQNNRLSIYTDGRDKFDALFEDIRQAKDHIHLEYYIVRKDTLAKQLLTLLAEKARQGVKTLLLYDAVGSNSVNKEFLTDFLEAGGKAEPFMPSKLPIVNSHMNYRNHRKIAVIDGTIGYTGGFNIGDEYLGKKAKFGYWRDTHLRITGGAVHSLQHRFLLDWNEASHQHPIKYASAYFPTPDNHAGAAIQLVSSGPDSELSQIKNGFLKLILRAQESIYIQTPYFIPDITIMDALRVAALSGIDVQIMIPDKSDHPFVHTATLSVIGDLLDTGAKVYTYHNGFLHAKTLIIDRKVVTTGSANMDLRSFHLNFEGNVFIYDREVASAMADIFFRDVELSGELTIEDYKNRSLSEKARQRFARLMAPLL